MTTTSRISSPVKKRRRAKENDAQKVAHGEASGSEEKEFDSDALDDDDPPPKTRGTNKRRRDTLTTRSPRKRGRKAAKASESDSDSIVDNSLNGQEVVGRVVQAPKTGQVPPGQISQNTFEFLTRLKDPVCNDRQWFKLHELVYRQAEKEWKDFVEEFTGLLTTVDTQIPHLPPKDVIHRIYRDIRFSNDKTPYKTGLSVSFSRSGRKGIFAGYFIAVKPGGESLIAAGSWCPARNELATIRSNIQQSSTRLRNILSAPEFVQYFGEPQPSVDGSPRSIFGRDDELKVAPKGVDKEHKDIDLLKCRSFAVMHKFSDEEVLEPDFKHKLADMVRIMRPFVHCLNDLMTIAGGGGGGGGSGGSGNLNGNGSNEHSGGEGSDEG